MRGEGLKDRVDNGESGYGRAGNRMEFEDAEGDESQISPLQKFLAAVLIQKSQ